MDVKMFNEFVGEQLTAVVGQQIRKVHGEENPIKYVRTGTLVSDVKPGRLLVHITEEEIITGFSRG